MCVFLLFLCGGFCVLLLVLWCAALCVWQKKGELDDTTNSRKCFTLQELVSSGSNVSMAFETRVMNTRGVKQKYTDRVSVQGP